MAAVVATVALALLLMLRFTPGEVQHPGSKLSPAEAPEASPRKAPSEQGPASAGPVPGSATGAKPDDFVRYTDDSGVVHLGNDQGRVPERYRSAVEVVAPGGRAEGGVTQVVCNGNLVLVPVTLKYRGREVQTVLLLDTGASNTTINENVAARLGLRQNDLRPSTSTVADGRKLQSSLFTAEAISVGGQTLPAAEVSLLPGSGGRGTEGLLGMNFLKEFRYHVDFKRSVIEWGH